MLMSQLVILSSYLLNFALLTPKATFLHIAYTHTHIYMYYLTLYICIYIMIHMKYQDELITGGSFIAKN